MLRAMAAQIASYADLDARMILPLGYSVRAPGDAGDDDASAVPADGAAKPRPGRNACGFVTLCFAADVLAEPSLLAAYASAFRCPATTPRL